MMLTRLYPLIKVLVFAASVLLIGMVAGRGEAEDAAVETGADADRRALQRIESYLNGIDTLKADFLQMAPDSSLAEGTVYIRRPGFLRVDYEPPAPLLIVGDGDWLTMIDYELKEVSRWPINDTPLKVLLKDDLDFDRDVEVLDVAREPGLIRVTVRSTEVAGQDRIAFLFSENPLRLRQWEIIDARGDATRVAIANAETGMELKKDLFTYDDPRPASRRPRGR